MHPTGTPPYAHERATDVVLRDGSTVDVRPVRREDEVAIGAFLENLSPQSIAFRLFGIPSRNWIVAWSSDVDHADRFALARPDGAMIVDARVCAHAAPAAAPVPSPGA